MLLRHSMIVDDHDRFFSGRRFTPADIDRIRRLITDHPHASRAKLSHLVCEALAWRTPAGSLKDMRCRVVMLRMHEQGLIPLPKRTRPPVRQQGAPPFRHHDPDTDHQPPISLPVHLLVPLNIHLFSARDRVLSRRCNTFIHRYHYLGFQPTAGANLRYRITAADGRELAYIVWASPAWKTAPRDRWIGWTYDQQIRRLPLLVNNTRFLILPWVHSANLASHILGIITRRLRHDWQQRFGLAPVLAETFVDATRFTGHCYRTANWINLGQTTGRSKWDRYSTLSVPKKDVWVYPLIRDPRRLLTAP